MKQKWILKDMKHRIEVMTANGSYAFTFSDKENAQLIASAPELLEALEMFLQLAGDVSNRKLWPKLGVVVDMAQAAINKARGI